MSDTGSQQQSPPEAPRKSGSGLGWLVLVLVVVGGGYAYSKGWLDGILASYFPGQQNSTSAPPVLSDAQDLAAPLVTQPALANELSGLIGQLGAIQTRVTNLETDSRQLQSLGEQLAEQVNTQSFTGNSAGNLEIARLRLELIDLRLRLNGDPQAAVSELALMASSLPRESSLQPLIEANRIRLGGVVSRQLLLEQFAQLEEQLASARQLAESELAAATEPDPEATKFLGFFSSLVKVSKDDSAAVSQLRLIGQLASLLPQSLNALLDGTSENYLKSLERLQDAASNLNNHNPTVVSSEITRTVSEIKSAGYPENFLLLDLSAGAS